MTRQWKWRVVGGLGQRYWELTNKRVLRRLGRPLSHLGLPPHVLKVDAAFVWGHHRRIYLVTGRTYWRLDQSGQSVLLHGYPRDVTGVWVGVKLPIDAAFTHTDGQWGDTFNSAVRKKHPFYFLRTCIFYKVIDLDEILDNIHNYCQWLKILTRCLIVAM